ncbi:lipase member J-like [Zophobas morio]|uniref:lipase member J-like n=1 Tax=Zophobas morio TaxID=2755281 RepID=UPI003083E209
MLLNYFKLTCCVVLNLSYVNSLNFNNNACRNLGSYPFKSVSGNCYENPDVRATTPEIIQRRGFKVESHLVTTPDGYILQIFRIPPHEYDNRKNKQPIFLLHSILSDSSAWVFAGNRSIPFQLASEGYDVWIGNQRGTIYSRGHVALKDSNKEYWDYNLDTLAANDIPSFLNKVAEVTGKAGSIIYMGHSRAIMLLFMYTSEHPEEIEQLLRGIVAFTPTAYLDPTGNVKNFFTVAQLLGLTLNKFGIGAIFQYPKPIIALSQALCPKFPQICQFVAFEIIGHSNLLLNEDLLNFFGHFPAPLSAKEIIQHGQFYETQRFQKFDYGVAKNIEIYGQDKPPLYNLRNVKVPTFICYGKKDVYISERTMMRIFNELGSERKAVYKIPINDENERHQFSHVDFLFAANLTELLYKDLREIIENELSV